MSQKLSLSSADIQQWLKNLTVFIAPVAVIYLVSVVGAVNASGVSLAAFVPNAVTVGAMVLYVLNGGLDIVRKFVADSTKQPGEIPLSGEPTQPGV